MKIPKLNQGLIDTLYGLFAQKPERFGCRAEGEARITTVSPSTWTAVQFDSIVGNFPEVYDRAAIYSASLSGGPYPIHQGVANPTRLLVPDPANREMGNLGGIYQLEAAIAFEADSVGDREIQIRITRKAGGTVIVAHNAKPAHASKDTFIETSTTVWMNPGDYAEVYAWHDASGLLELTPYANYTNIFCMTLLR